MKKRFERGFCHRFEIPGAYIRYQKNGVWNKMTNHLSGKKELLNISKGGLCFEDSGKAKIGEKVTVYLYLQHGVFWAIRGVVTWKSGRDYAGYYVGIKFLAFSNGFGYNPPELLEALRSLEAIYTQTEIESSRAA